MRKYFSKVDVTGLAVLIVYIIFISWRLFFYAYTNNYRMEMDNISYNLFPFRTIINYVRNSQSVPLDVLIYNLAGNIVAFIPLGFLLPASFKSISIRTTAAAAFAFISTVELLQLISRRGVFDLDDILLNMLGSLLGFAIYRLYSKSFLL